VSPSTSKRDLGAARGIPQSDDAVRADGGDAAVGQHCQRLHRARVAFQARGLGGSLSMLAALPKQARAWGDDGHKTIALISEHYLTPSAKKQIEAMLAADIDPLTQHDIASEATWADRYRDSITGAITTKRRNGGISWIWKSPIRT
jgi:S1/P1 Nuclease